MTAPYVLLKGRYDIADSAPDGDSIRFTPDRPDLWRLVYPAVRTGRHGTAQLRLEAVDGPETHYRARGGGAWRQPSAPALAAADALIEFLGFRAVRRDAGERVLPAAPTPARGFILTGGADRFGRSLAFVFRGGTSLHDGTGVGLDPELVQESANAHLLRLGLAYPDFHHRLNPALRGMMAGMVAAARAGGLGVWPADRTRVGVRCDDDALATGLMLPKLFRRLADHLSEGGAGDAAAIDRMLVARADALRLLPVGEAGCLADCVQVGPTGVALTVDPERLVFVGV